MIILLQKRLKSIYKDVVDWFACFVEKKTNFESFNVNKNHKWNNIKKKKKNLNFFSEFFSKKLKKIIFVKNNSKSLEKQNFNFSQKIIVFPQVL